MRMGLNRAVGATLVLGFASVGVRAQSWTADELDRQLEGLLDGGTVEQLKRIGVLAAAHEQSGRPIAARIQGDHREYLLTVERWIDRLTDERWLERERAERELTEIGGRALELLRDRRDQPRLLEEQIRCARIVEAIERRGTEREEREIRKLRGLVRAALYLPTTPALRDALVSALGHTDSEVVEAACRALGAHGQATQAAALRPLTSRSTHLRSVVRSAWSRMPGAEPLAACTEVLQDQTARAADKMALLRSLHGRADAAALIETIANGDDAMLAAGAGLALPQGDGTPVEALVSLGDRSTLRGTFGGLLADAVVLRDAVPGLPQVELTFAQCESIDFDRAAGRIAEGHVRVFLHQGSIITGELLDSRGDAINLASRWFGEVAIPRRDIRGIAIAADLDRLIGASAEFDRVRLRDHRFVDGTIRGLSKEAVVVETTDGSETRLPMQDVVGLLTRRPLELTSDHETYTRLDLVGGDRILGHVAIGAAQELGVVVPSIGAVAIPVSELVRIELEVGSGALWGFTMVADYSDNRLVEFDEQGRSVFVMEDVYGIWDVECLDSGNLLVTEFSVSRVHEVTRSGDVVWSFEDLRNPYDADRLLNGNTLIADTFSQRVIEVDAEGQIQWTFDKGIRPFDADRLANGNTLIADVLQDRVIEVSPAGKIVWERRDLPSLHDADRLPNGNTLITMRTLNRVVEVDPAGNEVLRLDNLNAPSDADRLPNGHTIVAENNMVREFDRNGNVVWKQPMSWAVEVNRY
ncbi:MAG: aryl-sulfate sulfotransferase [Planctomycetota bacterium]